MYENDYCEITLYLRVQCICTSSAGLNVPAPHRNISKSNVNPPKAPHKRKKEKKINNHNLPHENKKKHLQFHCEKQNA